MRSKQQPRPSYRRSTQKGIDNAEEEEEDINQCSEPSELATPPTENDTDTDTEPMQGDKSIQNATFPQSLKRVASADESTGDNYKIANKPDDALSTKLPVPAIPILSEHLSRLNELQQQQQQQPKDRKAKYEAENNNAYRNHHNHLQQLNRSNYPRDEAGESELGSPRCQSRESSASTGRQSADSNTSGNGSMSVQPPPAANLGIPLPSSAVLSAHQSAAMAAYLNAAAAVQQNRFNPFAANLVQSAQSSTASSMSSPVQDDGSVLDFSTKRTRGDSDTDSKSECEAAIDKANTPNADSSPLDLSTGGRNRVADEGQLQPPPRKVQRSNEYKPPNLNSVWAPINPYLAVVAAATISPKNAMPNLIANEATKALEKMSEMTKLGTDHHDMRSSGNSHGHSNVAASAVNNRHSAWQSHWLNKGADAAKDVFKCVWCKQSFPTLASLTTHMKETQHCGVNVPPTNNHNHSQPAMPPMQQHHNESMPPSSGSSGKSDLSLLIKETMPLPRKLVRGQDVWLGKGAEQTRQILKCMWCGQSFRSLAEMTSHMQQTQHYTNIISQEQIISWKSSEDKGGSGGGGGNPGSGMPPNAGNPNATSAANAGANNTVSAVLTCKVCDQAFSSLKDLSNHMVKNSHYKEHIMKSITESGGRKRQTREKRKKSLPVRKLLELERSQGDGKHCDMKAAPSRSPGDMASSTRITCEKCGEKIETAQFVDHIRQCVDGVRHLPKPMSLTPTSRGSADSRKSQRYDKSISPGPTQKLHAHPSPHASPSTKEPSILDPSASSASASATGDKSSASVLNAIEQLIEKSFDSRTRQANASFSMHNQGNMPLGSSILKRLGIDESVDYTKPLMDPQTMNLLRSYQQPLYIKRERSGSESSSVSDRGSSTRLESLTPERKFDDSARQSPSKPDDHSAADSVTVKTEAKDAAEESTAGTPASTPTRSSPHQPSHTTVLSPSSHSPSSERSLTPRSPKKSDKKVLPASLTALSSMFDNLNGSSAHGDGPAPTTSNSSAGSAHPLAALQKLCDKTENNPSHNRAAASGALAASMPNNSAGSMVAFSWACNDAATAESVFKCSFCDTSYSSKGAYRHHLSKVHFISNSDPACDKPEPAPSTSLSPDAESPHNVSNANDLDHPDSENEAKYAPPTTPTAANADESPHSKFLKYTELAKQLSSKYV